VNIYKAPFTKVVAEITARERPPGGPPVPITF
jgi:hypothetical protein